MPALKGKLSIVGPVSDRVRDAFEDFVEALPDEDLSARRPGFTRVEVKGRPLVGAKCVLLSPDTRLGDVVVSGVILDEARGIVEFDVRKLAPGRAIAIWIAWPGEKPQRVAVGSTNFHE